MYPPQQAIAIYDFSLGKWLYFDGSQFTHQEISPGHLRQLPKEPAWIKLRRDTTAEDSCLLP